MSRLFLIQFFLFAARIFSACPSLMAASAEDSGYRRLPVSEYRDRSAAGWLGQMVGVGWGAPTEFRFKGQIIPEESVPEWTPERINQFNQDDIYVEMTFLRSMEKRINPPEDTPQRSMSAPQIDIQEAVSTFAPGWAVSNCGNAMSPGFRPAWGGRACVLATHPLSTTVPNVVLFLVDDMGWTDLACYGSDFYETPNIDRLASEGVRFTDAYATCHVCSPSRASVLTGKYPARLDLTDWLTGRREFPFQRLKNAPIHQALPLEEITLAESLGRHGYRTGHFGKWHLGEHPAGPLQQGFDVQVPTNWYKGWPKAGYHAPFELDGIDDQPDDYLTDRLTDEVLKFIDDNNDEPFFLYLSHFAVHDPIQGRADLVAKYKKKRSRLPTDDAPFVLEENPDAEKSFTRAERKVMLDDPAYADHRILPNQMVKIKQRQDNPEFAAMVETVDESLGRMVAKLKSLGLDQNTIIIFTSDNGGMSAANFSNPKRVVHPAKLDMAYATSNLPFRGAKGWLYEGGIRVPLIIKWPGHGVAGSTCDEPVTGTDYYPTILDMVGVDALPEQHVDGESLCPLFHGAATLDRDAIFWHFPHYSNHGMQSPGGAIRRGRYKLLEYFENGTVQLFDLEADPGEQNDLSKTHPEIVTQLLDRLHRWREDVDAKMTDRNPNFDASTAVQQ